MSFLIVNSADCPYRSLDFHFEHYDEESYQGRSVVNYTVSEDYTRITEFKFLTGQKKYRWNYNCKRISICIYGRSGRDSLLCDFK